MLWLAELHGTNGLRTVINDYAERPQARFWLKTLLYSSAVLVVALGTLVIFTFDPTLDGYATEASPRMQLHRYDVVSAARRGAGGAPPWWPGRPRRRRCSSKLIGRGRPREPPRPVPTPHWATPEATAGSATPSTPSRRATTWSTKTPPSRCAARPPKPYRTWKSSACRSAVPWTG